MEIDPSGSIKEMIEACRSFPLLFPLPLYRIAPKLNLTPLADEQGAMGSMVQDLAFAIPGVDEAMGFAEIMK